jgi:cell division transport system permease protein
MDFEWAQKLKRFATFAERLVLLLGVLLATAVVFVTGNTIRLQILTQKDEIEVSQLIGATRRFIRRPFLYFGAFQGLLAGLVAVLAVLVFVWWAGAEVQALTKSYGSSFLLSVPTVTQSLGVVAVSALLGWFGAFLSVWLYLRRVTGN